MGKGVQVYRILEDNELEKIEDIDINYALDNLSVDGNGDIYAAALPRPLEFFKTFHDPFNVNSPSTVLRIRKGDDGRHAWEKILEDAEGATLPPTTTVVHDAKTGRLFLSGKIACDTLLPQLRRSTDVQIGVVSPYIAVCEPRS